MNVMDPTVPPYTDEDVTPIKPPAAPEHLRHAELLEGEFWRRIPAYREVDEATFLDHIWQGRNSVINGERLMEAISGLAPAEFIEDAREGFKRAPMAVRVSPYMMSLINWDDPYNDPIRTQFIPVASRLEADHPMLTLDSL
ncbi:MAG: KamA family radical SAM protein, partial [Cyanobacteria bacterium REEB65]|nr:KamA family radical SAM protein [Cyanobacteria bacterium REEB65]